VSWHIRAGSRHSLTPRVRDCQPPCWCAPRCGSTSTEARLAARVSPSAPSPPAARTQRPAPPCPPPGRLAARRRSLSARGKIRDVAIASRCLAALLGIVVTACGPVDVPAHVDWGGRTYIPVSICLDRSDVTDRALSVSASWERGSVPARPVVGISLEQAIAVDTEEWSRCRSRGWLTAVADDLSNVQEKVVLDRIRAVASPGPALDETPDYFRCISASNPKITPWQQAPPGRSATPQTLGSAVASRTRRSVQRARR
jgi:hypothetical protein